MTPIPETHLRATLFDSGIAKRGHYRFESGDHGDLWLDLDRLMSDTVLIGAWAFELAESVACRPDVVCGPQLGGAVLARQMAMALRLPAVAIERSASGSEAVRYRLADSDAPRVSGRRVLLVDDAINAGSAVRASRLEIERAAGDVVGLASLLVLGDRSRSLAREWGIEVQGLMKLDAELWPAETCPRCAAGEALETP